MPIGIPLVMGALALIAFATSTKKASAAGGGNGAPVQPEFQGMPLSLLTEMAKAVQNLTVTDFDADQKTGAVKTATITGPVTKEAVQRATQLAAQIEQAGFPIPARTLRDLAKLAGKKIPSPPKDKQVPLPAACFTAAETDSLNRVLQNERDPKVLQSVLDALKAKNVPAECQAQVQSFVSMLAALIVQVQNAIDEAEALRQTEDELKKKGAGSGEVPPIPGPSPAPGPVNPNIPPQPPGPTPRVYIVKSGDSFFRIAQNLAGDGNRWPELRDRNVPTDADGRKRAKDTAAKGGIKPILQPNQKLFIPESWPAVASVPINPGGGPAPVNPSVPPTPGVTPKVYIVKSGDSFFRIATNLVGDGNRWPELRDANVPQDADGRKRAKDTAAKGGIRPILQPNQKLFVPQSWNVTGVPVTPTPAPTPVVTPAVFTPPGGDSASLPPASKTRVTPVQSGDGFIRITQRLGVDGSRWHELRDRNVPVDADGRSRSKDTDAKGGIKPQLNPGNHLFVPESWPPSSFATAVAGVEVGLSGGDDATVILQKSPEELTAEALCAHLRRVQSKTANIAKARTKSDKRIIGRFQKLCNLPVDAKVTPATLLKAAEHGQCELPLVQDWPDGATAQHVVAYRKLLLEMAQKAQAEGDQRRAHELAESLKREKGQAAGLSAE